MLLTALVIVVLFHGGLLLSGSYQRTYDAYVHIFMADHYRRDWFSSWDQRWYTGFTVLGYPPGSHQCIAALSQIFGLRAGFVITQLFALLNLTVGTYRWAHLWVDHRAAGWACILLVISSSIAETVHVFGQLPTTFSLGFLLNSLPFAHRWVRTGSLRALGLGIVCTMATTAGHHVTTLFGAVFFAGPVLLSALLETLRTPLPGEPTGHPPQLSRHTIWPVFARRLRRILRPLARGAVYGCLLGAALLFVVLPYWLWSKSDPITQVSIPHASRANYLTNQAAGLVFWLVPWGTGLVVLPYALTRGFMGRTWPLAMFLGILAFLGTGGTTPLPKILLGGAYDILTLDRFTFWATISILPLAGQFLVSVTRGSLHLWLARNLGRGLGWSIPLLFAAAHLAFALFATNLTHYRPFQPATINVSPIVGFLEKDDHWRWRYLMLGFGDQMAWMSANTTAATVDGNYHSARRLPELTSRPIERLEGAKFSGVPGIGSLQQFLAVPGRYSLKYVFCNDEFYNPLLYFSGWHNLGPLENGIQIWERADVPPLPALSQDRQAPAWQRYLWGIVPPTSLLGALLCLSWAAAGSPLPNSLIRGIHQLGQRMPPARFVQALERRLATAAERIPWNETPAQRRWLPGRPLLRTARRHLARPISPSRRQVQVAALLLTFATFGSQLVATYWPTTLDPQQVVVAYYDHLDFRRFSAAWNLLDPRSRPDFTQYRLNLARDGGLVASFAKLSAITTKITDRGSKRLVVTAHLDYLTSLSRYLVDTPVEVRRTAERWVIDLPPADPTQPPDEFTSRAEPRFLEQGKRVVSSGATATADILDRPELVLGPVRTLRWGDRWVVVGSVTNQDTTPADVTVNAQLRDAAGKLLGSWDAAQILIHKLMPGETSPFRIDFQSIAGTAPTGSQDPEQSPSQNPTPDPSQVPAQTPASGATDQRGPVEFDPRTITPLAVPADSQVATAQVYARAVVTPRDTTRGIQVQQLRIEPSSGGYRLSGTIRNDTVLEASIPHLLLAYTDTAGAVVWVEQAYLEHSIGPQREITFQVPVLATQGQIQNPGIPTTGYAGPHHLTAPRTTTPTVPAVQDSGFAGIQVYYHAYQRGSAI